jgi:4-amino-4-deoxy-L-arabinose transferase-like glycosyltransferase
MAAIAATEIPERRVPDRARALAVVGVFLLAALGQLALERARTNATPPPVFAAIAFAGGAGLAVAALRKGEFLTGPPRPLEIPRYPPVLYAACVPGAICLLVVLLRHWQSSEGDPVAAKLWLLGLGLLLLPGLWDWLRQAGRRTAEEARQRRRFIAVALLLFTFAFTVRIWGGIERIPGWLDSDEGATGIDGRASLAGGLGSLFGFWEMGNPNLTLVVSQLAARPFGEGLRALRLGSALLGSLTVVLLFDFGRRLVGSRAAFLAAFLLAANHVFVHFSRVGQIYIDTPFFASLVLALLLRVLTGGSFLALAGAGIALGIGAATYISTEILPILVLLTLVGWAIVLRWPARRVLPVVTFLSAVVVLTCAPIVATILRITPEIAYQRVPAISVLQPEGLRQLAGAYRADSEREAVGKHVLQTIGIFNFGSDHFKAYGANRPIDDAVTAALVPVAGVLLFWRLSSPLGWVSVVFGGAYLTGAVLLTASQPSFHRVLVVLLFSSLAVAWTLIGLTRALAASVSLHRWAPIALALAVAGISAWLNLHYYFRELPLSRLTEASFGIGKLTCRYAGTHTVIDATAVEGYEYVSTRNQYPDLECPAAERLRIDRAARLWTFPDRTDARQVVVFVPSAVESANPGQPRGYRLVRRTVDRSIRWPVDLPLSILEFERFP